MIGCHDACVPCLKFRNSCGLEISGGMKPKAAPCGKLIFLLAVYGVVWCPDKPRVKETTQHNTLAVCPQQKSGKANTTWVLVVFLIVRNPMDNKTFSVPQLHLIPIKCSYITVKKYIPKTFIHCVVYWPAPRLLRECGPCSDASVLSFSLRVCVWRVNVSMFRFVHPPGTAAVRFPKPFQKAIFTVRGLREPTLLEASQDGREEHYGAGGSYKAQNFVNTDTFRCSSNSHQTLWIRGSCLRLSHPQLPSAHYKTKSYTSIKKRNVNMFFR